MPNESGAVQDFEELQKVLKDGGMEMEDGQGVNETYFQIDTPGPGSSSEGIGAETPGVVGGFALTSMGGAAPSQLSLIAAAPPSSVGEVDSKNSVILSDGKKEIHLDIAPPVSISSVDFDLGTSLVDPGVKSLQIQGGVIKDNATGNTYIAGHTGLTNAGDIGVANTELKQEPEVLEEKQICLTPEQVQQLLSGGGGDFGQLQLTTHQADLLKQGQIQLQVQNVVDVAGMGQQQATQPQEVFVQIDSFGQTQSLGTTFQDIVQQQQQINTQFMTPQMQVLGQVEPQVPGQVMQQVPGQVQITADQVPMQVQILADQVLGQVTGQAVLPQ